MKKIHFIIAGLLLFTLNTTVYSQAKRPKLMVMPESNWCIQHGYFKSFDNEGSEAKIPDYDKALLNEDIRNAISRIEERMNEREFPLENLSSRINSIRNRNALRAARTRKTAENPMDALVRDAKADIILELAWSVKKNGPYSEMMFTLTGKDAYTDKSIANAVGAIESTAAGIAKMLDTSVLGNIDNFCSQLQAHFDNLLANGREITFDIEMEEGALDDGFDTRFDGQALSRIIRKWMTDNTKNGNFSIDSSDETYMVFDQVRIEMYDADGVAQSAAIWAEGLTDMLENKYKLLTKVENVGLGRVQILIIK